MAPQEAPIPSSTDAQVRHMEEEEEEEAGSKFFTIHARLIASQPLLPATMLEVTTAVGPLVGTQEEEVHIL